MRRAGGWILGAIAIAAMGGGAWVAFRPILNRETIRIAYVVAPDARIPSSDAMISGARFAVEEAGGRAGAYRVEFDVASSKAGQPFKILMTVDPQYVLQADFLDEPWIPADPLPSSLLKLRLLPPAARQGRAAAEWAKQTGSQSVALIYDEANPVSGLISVDFRSAADSIHLPYGEARDTAIDREQLLGRVLASKPDLVFYAGESAPYSTAYDIFEALRKKGYAGRLAMGDADPEVSFLAVSNRVVEGTYLVSTIGPPSAEFAKAYEPATGRLAGPHAWPAYRTMRATLGVISQASSSRLIDLAHQAELNQGDSDPCSLYVLRGGRFVFVQSLK